MNTSEDWIKQMEDWPANIQKRKRQLEQEKNKENKDPVKQSKAPNKQEQERPEEEHEWKRESDLEGDTKHHDAYGNDEKYRKQQQTNGERKSQESEYQRLLQKYSSQEITLLRSLQHEKDHLKQIKQNDGNRESPAANFRPSLSIDEVDQFSPDNWIPRSSALIRLTGKHPLNAEPQLTSLFDAGLVTPNEYHYVRNHAYTSLSP